MTWPLLTEVERWYRPRIGVNVWCGSKSKTLIEKRGARGLRESLRAEGMRPAGG